MTQTLTRHKKAKRNKRIYDDLQKLLSVPGAMPTACIQVIMKKYKVSESTVYRIKDQSPV
jgi:hypothetical protein